MLKHLLGPQTPMTRADAEETEKSDRTMQMTASCKGGTHHHQTTANCKAALMRHEVQERMPAMAILPKLQKGQPIQSQGQSPRPHASPVTPPHPYLFGVVSLQRPLPFLLIAGQELLPLHLKCFLQPGRKRLLVSTLIGRFPRYQRTPS